MARAAALLGVGSAAGIPAPFSPIRLGDNRPMLSDPEMKGAGSTDFDAAFDATMGHEGGYANDPSDFGGETYRGIARRFHPGWPGWIPIDSVKVPAPQIVPESTVIDAMRADLDPLVREFYRVEFWLKVGADHTDSQAVAAELFDTAVNMSPSRAAEFLQVALNALNRSDRGAERDYFADLVEDGDPGPKTQLALQIYLSRDPDRYLLTLLNVQQGAFYLERMRKIPSQERFARGWLKRVELVRSRT